jgi:hypothetical protein
MAIAPFCKSASWNVGANAARRAAVRVPIDHWGRGRRVQVELSIEVGVHRLLHDSTVLEQQPSIDLPVVVPVLRPTEHGPASQNVDDTRWTEAPLRALEATLAALAVEPGGRRRALRVARIGTIRPLR